MAAKGNVKVSILGDARDLMRATGQAENSLSRLQGHTAKVGSGMAGAFKVAGAAIAAAGVAKGISDIVKAAADAEASEAKVKNLLGNLGISYEKHKQHIDSV